MELTSRINLIENDFFFFAEHHLGCDWDFSYSPEEDVTFASDFRRYEDLYKTDCGNWMTRRKSVFWVNWAQKIRNYILPRKTCELTFTEAVKLLLELFSPKTYLSEKMEMSWSDSKRRRRFYHFCISSKQRLCRFQTCRAKCDIFKYLISCKG